MRTSGLLLALLTFLSARSSFADLITLKDGSIREGRIVERTEGGVSMEVSLGNMKTKIFIARADIASIQEKAQEPDPAELEVRRRKDAAAGSKEAAEWLALAKFLDSVPGYAADAEKAYEKVLELASDNAEARKRLGYIRDRQGRWIRVAEAMRAAGMVRAGDEWVTPEERSLRIDRKESKTMMAFIGPAEREGAAAPSLSEQREKEIRAAEKEVALRNYNRLLYGESLLARMGYYDYGVAAPWWGYPPVYYPPIYEGTYLSAGDGDIFVGRVGWPIADYRSWGYYGSATGGLNVVGPVPLYFERGGWATIGGTGAAAISPGLIYRSGDNVFSFGTNFGGGWGYGGWGFSFSRDAGNTKIRLGVGGSSWSGGAFFR